MLPRMRTQAQTIAGVDGLTLIETLSALERHPRHNGIQLEAIQRLAQLTNDGSHFSAVREACSLPAQSATRESLKQTDLLL